MVPGSNNSLSSWGSVADSVASRATVLVNSPHIEGLLAILIVLNTLCMAFELQCMGIDVGFGLEYPGFKRTAAERYPGAMPFIQTLDKVFTVIFCTEIVTKLVLLRWAYITSPINWLDIVAVAPGVILWLVEGLFPVNPITLRLLRLAKLGRGMRLAKISRVLDSLQLMLKCLTSSLWTLAWSLCVLFVFQSIIGMIINQLAIEFSSDPSNNIDSRHRVFEYWGTFVFSQITMSEVHLANWGPIARDLMEHMGIWYGGMLTAYRCLAGFAVLNVINAIFIQQTMKVAQGDTAFLLLQKQRAQEQYSSRIRMLFQELDDSGDGFVSWEEFHAVSQNESFKNWLSVLEIDVHDLKGLFEILDTDGDRCISVDELIRCVAD